MALQPGSLLNQRYSIERVIASGGMGAVYEALDTVLNIKVAVKENSQSGEQFTRQFRREAALLSQLNHPNLPRVTDHFAIPESGQYLVMDFIEGQDLRERLAQHGPMPENEVVAIGSAVCNALAYLHTRRPPIIHRDIKPGNIKLTSTSHVYLVDFGLAKFSQTGQATTTGAQALTPGYAPPEQYGQGTEPRSDIYALGATLYAILTGKIPQDSLERAMGTTTLTPIHKLNPEVSLQTAAAIEKALSIRMEDRFQDAGEFCSALTAKQNSNPVIETRPHPADSASHAQPTLVRPSTSPSHPSVSQPAVPANRKSRRGYLVAILAGVFILGLATVLTILWKANAVPAEQPTPAQISLATTTPGPTRTTVPSLTPPSTPTDQPSPTLKPAAPPQPSPTDSPSPTPAPAATPLGGGSGELAISSNRGGTTQIWLVHSDGTAPTQITNLPDGACQPDWSPDGSRLVFVSPCSGKRDSYPGSSLFIININGKGLVPLKSLPGGDFDPAWSPDGSTIAFTSLRGGKDGIYLYDLANQSAKRISSPVNVERRPAWSPDGTAIAYETHRQGKPQVWIMNADGTQMREFSKLEGGNSTSPAWAPQNASATETGLVVYSQGSDLPYLVGRVYNDPTAEEFRISNKITGILDARYAPDGFWLAFTQLEPQGATSIYLMMSNGGNQTLIPGGQGGDFHPTWRPQ